VHGNRRKLETTRGASIAAVIVVAAQRDAEKCDATDYD
jgi:hypothetical protein